MARRGFGGTALRAALGAVTGYAEGLQAKEAAEYERERIRKAEERQSMLDAAALRGEQRQAISSGMISADQFAGMTMPGAVPMQPALRQKIGDTEYVYSPEVVRAEKHRESVMARAMEKADEASKDKALDDLTAAAIQGGRRSPAAIRLAARSKAAYDAAFPEPKGGGGGLTAFQNQELKERMDRAEAIFNTEGLDPAQAKAISSTYKSLRKAYPSRPPRELIMMAVEGGMKAQPTPKQTGGKDDWSALMQEAKRGKSGAATTQVADDPSKMTEQQLWDRVAATSGVEYATKTYGPRP